MVMPDISGNLVWRAVYDSFGEANVQPSSTITNNLRFPGQYYDSETGLHYNWYRYYEPEIGRYLRTDPIGFLGGDINLYRYVWSRPISFFDPWGLITTIFELGFDSESPFKGPGKLGILRDDPDFGVAAQLGILDISYSSENGLGVSLTTPGFGFGGFMCFNLCDKKSVTDSDCQSYPFNDKPLEPVPLIYSAGAGRRLGISFGDDFCNLCINVGPSVGLPINIGLPLGMD